jgi:hypothetical protein
MRTPNPSAVGVWPPAIANLIRNPDISIGGIVHPSPMGRKVIIKIRCVQARGMPRIFILVVLLSWRDLSYRDGDIIDTTC